MKEFIEVYEQNKEEIEFFIIESIQNIDSIEKQRATNFKKLFQIFTSLELIYEVDKNSKIQSSPNIYRNKMDLKEKGKNRSYLISKQEFKHDGNIAFSQPYVSSATGNNCISVSIKEGEKIIFMDFALDRLLERLNLIEMHKSFHTITKGFYSIAGFSMMALALFIIFYALGNFFNSFFIEIDFKLDNLFKPIVALTLGIAIFDLAKTILEQEVFFKSYSKNSKVETKMITKFLITIIIALSIEALMVVFKIALDDYDKMVNALYLITGVSMIIVALALFIKITTKRR